MSDYIRREDASDWLKQYGQDVLHGQYKFSLMYIWKNLMALPSADVVQVEELKAEIYKLKHQSEQGFRNHDYYVGYISALSTVEGILAWLNEEE